MIELRTVRDELDRFDELHQERLCACCADDPEAQGSDLRRAFERAAAKGSNFLVCANCATRWIVPEPADIDYAVRGWMMIISEHRLVATLCGPCAASNPEPALLPRVGELILRRQSRGPLQ